MSLSPVWTCTFKYEWKWARTPLKPGVDVQTACSFRFKYCIFFSPLLNNSYHMGWASASQLLNYKHSFDCKLNGKGCQLSLSSRGHTTRAPAVKNWHSCSERHHMLLLWAEQDLTLALLTLLLCSGEMAEIRAPLVNVNSLRHSQHLSHPILLPLKEVKVYLGRWLSVLSFREEALAWARVSHTDFEVCYEIINAVSLKAPHWPVQLTDRIAWCPAWMPEQNCSGFSEMVWNRTIPLCPGHTINKNHKQHECVQGESGQGGRSCWDLEQWTGYSMTRDSWARRGSCVGTCVLTWSVAAELGAGSEQGCSCCCKGLPALGSGRARARPYLLCPLTLLFLDSQCHCWTSPNGYSLCDVKLLGRMGSLTIRVFPYLCWSLQVHDWLKNLCFCWALQWMVRCIMYLS